MTAARLRAALERDIDAMIERTAALVAIDSGSHDPEGVDRVSALMAEPLAGLGFAVERLPLEGRGDRVSATLALGDGPKLPCSATPTRSGPRARQRNGPSSVAARLRAGPASGT